MGHTPHTRSIGPGSGSGGARPQPADTNAAPFNGFLNLLYFRSPFFILAFGANSETFGEVTPSTWTRNDSRVLGDTE